MFTFSCLPQVMEQMTKPHTTIIWICWFADQRDSNVGRQSSPELESQTGRRGAERQGWGPAGVRLSVLGQLSHCLAV